MYNKILVPLDGSKLAECALPYAEELAKGYGAERSSWSALLNKCGRTRKPLKPGNSMVWQGRR